MSAEESSGRKRKQISYAENINIESKRKKLPNAQSNLNSRNVSRVNTDCCKTAKISPLDGDNAPSIYKNRVYIRQWITRRLPTVYCSIVPGIGKLRRWIKYFSVDLFKFSMLIKHVIAIMEYCLRCHPVIR